MWCQLHVPTALIVLWALTAGSSAEDTIDFRPVAGFLKLPEGMKLGPCSGVDIDSHGKLGWQDGGFGPHPAVNADPSVVTGLLGDGTTPGSTHITADNSPVKHQFVRFSVSGIGSRAVQSAKLRLYCVDPSDKGGDFHASDATWSESTLTWDVQPAINPTVVSSLGSVSSGTWYEADVTPVVSADGAVSLATTSTSTNGAYYSSKEGTAGLAPQLVVTLEPPDTTPDDSS